MFSKRQRSLVSRRPRPFRRCVIGESPCSNDSATVEVPICHRSRRHLNDPFFVILRSCSMFQSARHFLQPKTEALGNDRRRGDEKRHNSWNPDTTYPSRAGQVLHRLASCFVVPSIDYFTFSFMNTSVPRKSQYDQVCTWCSQKHAVDNDT